MAVYKQILVSKQKQIDSYMQFMVSQPLTYSQKEKLEIEIQKLIKEKNQMLNSSLADLLQIQIYTIQAASWINKT